MNKLTILRLARSKKAILAATSAFSTVAGACAGYVLAQKKLEAAYEDRLVKEIEKTKQFYSLLYSKPSPEELNNARKDAPEVMVNAVKAVTDYASPALQGEVYEDRPSTQAEEVLGEVVQVTETEAGLEVKVNVFEGKEAILEHSDNGWDYEEEIAQRSPLEPYIIHHDEYFQGELDYQQSELTYFAEDGVLCDDRSQPIHDSNAIVGDTNLMRFGHGSKDNNILYIRNDALEIDMTVVRSSGSYTGEVLGIQHSDEPRRRGRARRLRDDDE